MESDHPYDAGREAYLNGKSRCGEIPFYDDYSDECLWVDGWDDAKRKYPSCLLPAMPEITLPTFDGPPNFNLVEEN